MIDLLRGIGRQVFGKLMPRVAYPVLRGPMRGTKLVLGSIAGEGGGASAYFNMLENEQTACFERIVRVGDVVFDIGANVGYYTLLGSRLVGRSGAIVAVEPSVRNLYYIFRHIIINMATNITVVPVACSNTAGLAPFHTGQNSAMGHLDTNGVTGVRGEVTIVPTVTVDALVDQFGAAPHVLKVDVEGAELLLLKGVHATLSKARPMILLSTHSDQLKIDCSNYLKQFGYQFTPLTASGFDEATEFLVAPD